MDDGQEKAPSTKHQAPEKLQASNTKTPQRHRSAAFRLQSGGLVWMRYHNSGHRCFWTFLQPKGRAPQMLLRFVWSFSGAWSLELGASAPDRLHAGGAESFARRPAAGRTGQVSSGGEKVEDGHRAAGDECAGLE